MPPSTLSLQPQNATRTIPAQPKLLKTPFAYVGMYGVDGKTNPSQIVFGAIGVTTNGIEIYGNADAAGRNAYQYEAITFDTCGGHPNPADQVRELLIRKFRNRRYY